MTRVWHLVRHDFRSQRLPLLLFAVVLAAETTFILMGRFPWDRATFFPVMPLLRLCVTSLVTALIVQRDPLVGSTAFWRTRPIDGGGLLAGKCSSIALALLVVPSLVLGSVWWSTGFRFVDAAVTVGTIGLEQATVILLTMMAAVVTPSMTQLVVAGVAGTTAVTVLNGILLPALATTWPFVGVARYEVNTTWYLGLLFIVGVPAIVHQYLTLREWRTAALVGVALLAASGGARVASFQEDEAKTPVNRSLVDPSAVEIRVVPDSHTRYEQSRSVKGKPTPFVYYDGALSASGHPSSILLRLHRIESRLLLPDETVTTTRRLRHQLADTLGGSNVYEAHVAAMQAALGTSRFSSKERQSRPLGRDAVFLTELPSSVDARYLGTRAVLTGRAEVEAMRFVIAAAAPVRPGAVLRTRGIGLVIEKVSPASETPIGIRLSDINQLSPMLFGSDGAFILRNARRHEALLLFVAELRGAITGTAGIARNGLDRTTMSLKLPPANSAYRGPGRPPDAAWMADAELLLLTAESVGTFTREFQTEIVVGK